MQGKVEICGVNTAKLRSLKPGESEALLRKIKAGDREARQTFIEGNLRQESLRKIWEDPDRFAYNRGFTKDDLTGDCATCELGEYCGGGCRSYNYFVHGRMFESPCCARLEETS